VRNADAEADVLTDMIKALAQIFEKANLDLVGRREVRGHLLLSLKLLPQYLSAVDLRKRQRIQRKWGIMSRFPGGKLDAYLDAYNVAVVTGASKGIGAAIAEEFAKEGAALHLVRRDLGAEVAAHTARLAVMPLERAGGQVQFIVHEVLTMKDKTAIGRYCFGSRRICTRYSRCPSLLAKQP
jgi:hypothetical protein